MNAPFQARAGLREPFTAFVCDDETADLIGPVAVEYGWSAEKVNKGGLRNAVQSLSVSASPNVLFIDLSEKPLRMPDEDDSETILGITLPRIALVASEASAAAKTTMAFDKIGLHF